MGLTTRTDGEGRFWRDTCDSKDAEEKVSMLLFVFVSYVRLYSVLTKQIRALQGGRKDTGSFFALAESDVVRSAPSDSTCSKNQGGSRIHLSCLQFSLSDPFSIR